MSLLDTINGAREEIAQSGNPFARADADDKDAAAAEGEVSSGTGFSKRSTARAKPSREAARSVRVVSSEEYHEQREEQRNRSLTKEERKAREKARAKRAESADDRRNAVARHILNGHAGYKRSQRIWLGLIIIGVIVTLLTYTIGTFIPDETGQAKAVVAVILLVVAYGCVIGAFVYDWRVVRPMRKAAEEETNRMSDKRIRQYLNEHMAAEREALERGEKPSLLDRILGN